MFQIIFNEISAAEISQLPTESQLDLLEEFKVTPEDLENLDTRKFARIERDGKVLYRYRAKGCRIYFEVADEGVVVDRVLSKNTFRDFIYRSKLPVREGETISRSKVFWELIEEGQRARRV